MEKQLDFGYWVMYGSPIPLQKLVDSLMVSSLPAAEKNESRVINEVGRGFFVQEPEAKLLRLMDDVIHTVVQNSKMGDIHISAERLNGNTVLQIEERNNYNGYALSFSIGSLAYDAAKVGGELVIRDEKKLVTVVSLSLPETFAA